MLNCLIAACCTILRTLGTTLHTNPIKLSDSSVEVTRSPLLGEHTEEILRDVLGYSSEEIAGIGASGAVGELLKAAE